MFCVRGWCTVEDGEDTEEYVEDRDYTEDALYTYSVSEDDEDDSDDTEDALLRGLCPSGARVFRFTES